MESKPRRDVLSHPSRRAEPPQQNKHERHNIMDLWMRHEGADIFIVGTGTSLADFDWSRLRGKITIALNDALLAPFHPTYHIFSDVGIWTRYRELKISDTIVVCQRKARDQFIRYENCLFKERVYHFNHVGRMDQLKVQNDDLFISRTIATGAICLAWKLGARRIFILGVDGYKKIDGTYYWNGGRKSPQERRSESRLDSQRVTQDRHDWWKKNMREVNEFFGKLNIFRDRYPGSGIFNLSPLSVIDAWEKVDQDIVFSEVQCIGMLEQN